MEKSHINTRREFLQKLLAATVAAESYPSVETVRGFKPLAADQMLAIEAKTKPYYKELLFFKNLSELPAEW